MTLSEYLVQYLYKKGITHIFELTGGMVANFLNAFYQFEKIKVVTMHHEQAVSFATDGFARISNLPGVAFATSGPGAINLLTGIGNCYFDSVPAIFITGQVNSYEQKGDRNVRQFGFQETDILSMAKPICKAVFEVKSALEFPAIIEEAFKVALSGRPGPVLIDVPMNFQKVEITEIDFSEPKVELIEKKYLSDINWGLLNEKLNSSKRPLILAGRGIQVSASKNLLINFAEKNGIPIVTSLHALDVIPYNHPLRVGFIGTYGNRWSNILIGESDLIIVLGSRLDIRQTGANVDFFSNRTIFHIDIDSNEINNRIKNCYAIVEDINIFLTNALEKVNIIPTTNWDSWYDEINASKVKYPDDKETDNVMGINPNSFMHLLSRHSDKAGAFLADVGNHQMWCAQSLELNMDQYFLSSGGMGAMGYCLPAAIGACFALNKPVVSISGDGGFQLNIQELQTIVRNRLPIKIVVINNKSLGMIRQFQESYFDCNYQSSIWGYSCPDFEKVANSYNIKAKTISEIDEIEDGLVELWSNPYEPFLLQVMIDTHINCYPKIAFGKPLTEMEPISKPIEL
ncbi:MAG: thiamine pyrophosphate-binding protein [Paludibacter sp.]|nr:thiamine pyrophosphate-binding protein [Paludibacter sp.]